MEISESLIYFWLSRTYVGAHKINAIARSAPIKAIWEEPERFRQALGDKYGELVRTRSRDFLCGQLEKLRGEGIGVMTRANPSFPERLRQKEVSPPLALYYMGDSGLLSTDSVAIVGTRACSSYGQNVAQRLASGIASEGLTVVSGLATGIDGYALRAALDSGGKVITVVASGLDKITPVSNTALFEEMSEKGLAVSELPPGTEAMKFTFPERNRLIAGLTLGTVVVEAPEKSGALLTAEFALEQGRELFAVPGNVTSPRSAGTNALIADGAKLVRGVGDILSELGIKPRVREPDGMNFTDAECAIIRILQRDGSAHFDSLCDCLGLKPYELTPLLVGLELKDVIIRLPANNYAIKDLIK